ncbi:ABC transporter substrate-binding protein [Oceanicella sp. SM1341]|uniref:ABC transporter substrate-binding protein n=1 Tax=Oceanicella sp. SM1341 TaxID=1548889 RepID=UPI000E4E8429|nr:ABC transporter substrate-binding protein [Oceanicella sp. SM1341]
MKRFAGPILASLGIALLSPLGAMAQDAAQPVRAAVLRVERGPELPISRLDLPPDDLGFAGGRLATEDNQTTGRFMGQDFTTEDVDADPDTAVQALETLIADGTTFIAVMAGPDTLLALADAAGDRALIVNATAQDTRLREADCRANVMHVAPSRAMLADALTQFLVWKKWTDWLLVPGSHPEDALMADAYRASAKKFGARIVEERVFEDTGGARRTDTGHVLVQRQMPVFTQRAEAHDVLVAADEADVFAAYLPYQSWDPRPVAGSAGLRPMSWHPALEAWGATQFQRRFERAAGRTMRPEDYQVWMALRVLGEAATRTKATDFATLRDYILSPAFELAAFKGQKLTFRPWNHQLRQPVVLAADRVIVSVSPQEEFLHRVSRLDTLGVDEPETTCDLN